MTASDHLVLEIVLALWALLATLAFFHERGERKELEDEVDRLEAVLAPDEEEPSGVETLPPAA